MADKKLSKTAQMEQQQIIQAFQQMRNEQRSLMQKITELEQESTEHKVVIETLQDVSGDRRCFRMVGGVLVERTVSEVVPALSNNRDQLAKLLETLTESLVKKGKEINEYREKHGIRMRGQEAAGGGAAEGEGPAASSGVLVANKA